MTPEQIATASAETERLAHNLDITNVDHVALWLDENLSDASPIWLACRIVEAHEAILAALKAQLAGEDMVERVAIRDITGERERQITDEHWSPEHDDKHSGGEMAMAAACYAYGEIIDTQTGYCLWPWFEDWWKPADTRRNLVKAGALIVAEIERLDRAAIAAMQESRDAED